MAIQLPPLPFSPDALEPHIDKATMEIHHGKHHAAYVDEPEQGAGIGPELQDKPVHELLTNNLAIVPDAIKTAVRNNGGGHHNHSLFWQIDRPTRPAASPSGNLAKAIDSTFGVVRQVQGAVHRRRHDAVRLRLGVAGEERAASWRSSPPPTRTAR